MKRILLILIIVLISASAIAETLKAGSMVIPLKDCIAMIEEAETLDDLEYLMLVGCYVVSARDEDIVIIDDTGKYVNFRYKMAVGIDFWTNGDNVEKDN